MKKLRFVILTASTAAISLLGGCVTPTIDTKTVISNSDDYLAKNFTPAQLAAPVRTLVEKGDPIPKLFSRIEYKGIADHDDEGRATVINFTGTMTNLGNGFIQHKIEYSRNGVPYRINLSLTFAGVSTLKFQGTFVDRANANFPIETKEVNRFDRGIGKPQSGQTYTVSLKTGTPPQLMNFTEDTHACVAGPAVQASTVHEAFPGNAVPLDCTRTGVNGLVSGKRQLMWIADLGVAFPKASSTASFSSKERLTSVSVIK